MIRFFKSDLPYSLLGGFLAGALALHFMSDPVERPALSEMNSTGPAIAAPMEKG